MNQELKQKLKDIAEYHTLLQFLSLKNTLYVRINEHILGITMNDAYQFEIKHPSICTPISCKEEMTLGFVTTHIIPELKTRPSSGENKSTSTYWQEIKHQVTRAKTYLERN